MTLLRYNSVIDFTDKELDSLICAGIKTVQSLIIKDASAISQSTAIPAKVRDFRPKNAICTLTQPDSQLSLSEDKDQPGQADEIPHIASSEPQLFREALLLKKVHHSDSMSKVSTFALTTGVFSGLDSNFTDPSFSLFQSRSTTMRWNNDG